MNTIIIHKRILTALMSALLCILAPLSIPMGSMPLSLASFGVYLCALLLGGGYGTAAVFIYLLLGAIGVPVFAGFTGGVQMFAGVTGGFLLGYLPCVLVAGWLCRRFSARPLLWGVFLFVGTTVLYLCGTVWIAVASHIPFWSAVTVGCLPFLPFDIVKMAAAVALIYPLRKHLMQYS